jgi:beta-glucanase (GH16 family)
MQSYSKRRCPTQRGAYMLRIWNVRPSRRRFIASVVITGVLLSIARPIVANDTAPPTARMHVTFESHFDSLNNTAAGEGDWMTTGASGWRTLGNNKEAEYYSDASVGTNPFSVRDHVLTITASRGNNPAGLPFNSGMLTTYRLFSQRYGYFEMRAQLPTGAGLWPAFWLLPVDGSWPPEIDVMESLGSVPHTIYVGTHSAVGGPNVGTTTPVHVGDTSNAFHVYGLDWQPTEITWFFDDKPVFKEPTPADMHTPMYMLINLAVGGRDSWPGPPVRATVFPAHFNVDYLRVYSH